MSGSEAEEMDEVDAFFKGGAVRVHIEGPESNGWVRPSDRDSATTAISRPSLGLDYCKEEYPEMKPIDIKLEEPSLEMIEETRLIYEKYNFKGVRSQKLPIDSLKTQILETIAAQTVTIIEGPTGSGKSTQVPKWILKDCQEKRSYCNIIVTQPRRIGAICVAKRVAYEHDCDLGELIGYQIGLDRKISQDTRLQYVTTGVLLQQIVSKRSFSSYTHIILDEVHERDKDMDFLLIIIRKLININVNIKVVLMSATFNTDKFKKYFEETNVSEFEDIPVISLSNTQPFPVGIYYLEYLTKIDTMPIVDADNPELTQKNYEFVYKLLNAFEDIDLIEESSKTKDDQRPCVLIFLPGFAEIEDLYNILNNDSIKRKITPTAPLHKWWLVPLHSTITTDEQIRAFQKPPDGYRKILLATNIAESSITVPDIKYVIDFCLTKISVCNSASHFSSLRLCWASQTNCKQRAGRVGRVRPGRVYRLVPLHFYNSLPTESSPEIQRCNLENLVLHAKIIDIGPPKSILALAMDPPDLSCIQRTILVLKEVGALFKKSHGKFSNDDGDITYLGRIMSKLPLDIRISKLIMLGYIFGCFEECIIIGAALSTRNIFSNPFMDKMNAFNSKLTWAHGSTSDCIAFLHVYKIYKRQLDQNGFLPIKGGEKGWAKKSFLQIKAVRDLHRLVSEIKSRLSNENINDITETTSVWKTHEKSLVLKMLIAGAFYPNYFILSNVSHHNDRESAKTLNGKDPRNTVYLSNMDNRQPGQLYESQLKKNFDVCSSKNIIFDFDVNSRKIFVTFPMDYNTPEKAHIPGNVILPVYQAIKMRQLKVPLILNVLPLQKSLKYATELGLNNSVEFNKATVVEKFGSNKKIPKYAMYRLPGIDESYIKIFITTYINCSHFWARNDDEMTKNEFEYIDNILSRKSNLFPLECKPKEGEIYAAPFYENKKYLYHRARIDGILDSNSVSVFFIDYGNQSSVEINALREFSANVRNILEIRPLVFECILSEIGPSLIGDPRGLWTNDAKKRFIELTEGKLLHGKVYSVVNSVISIELFDSNENINDILIKEGHAQIMEESYASKTNRALREKVYEMQPSEILIHNNQQEIQNVNKNINFLSPNINECVERIHLKGPFSPLETNVNSVFCNGIGKSVHIEWDSVNSVLLNTDPQNNNERLLIAAEVKESSNGISYSVRHTTLMPNIPGLTALVGLIFSPVAELRCDPYYTCYVAMLCGLGHIEGKSIFPEHDIVLNINVELNNYDLENINFLRQTINNVLLTFDDEETLCINENVLHENRNLIRRIFNNLLSCHRKQHDFTSLVNNAKWNNIDPTKFLKLSGHKVMFGDHEILPSHNGIQLSEQNMELQTKLAVENAKLHSLCSGINSKDNIEVTCTLCGTYLHTIQSLRLHLYSRMHREREMDLGGLQHL